MRIIKTASGKKTVKMSKKEWQSIGKKAGWMKEAIDESTAKDINNSLSGVRPHDHPKVNPSNVLADDLAEALSYCDDLSGWNDSSSNLSKLEDKIEPFLNSSFEALKGQSGSFVATLIEMITNQVQTVKNAVIFMDVNDKQFDIEIAKWRNDGVDENLINERMSDSCDEDRGRIDNAVKVLKQLLTVLLNQSEVNN